MENNVRQQLIDVVLPAVIAQAGVVPLANDMQNRIVEATTGIVNKIIAHSYPPQKYLEDALQSILLICKQKGDEDARLAEISKVCQRCLK